MVIIQGISADGDVLVKGLLTYKYHVSRGRTAYSDDELSITVSWWFGHMVFLDFLSSRSSAALCHVADQVRGIHL